MSAHRACALAALLGAALLAGCAVGPNYRTPDRVSTAPAAFAETSDKTAAAPPPGRWWRLYANPDLDRLVDKALVRNTDLRLAQANLAQARAVLAEARAGRLPSTALSAGAAYGASGGASAHWTYDAAFDASYEVDLFGRIRRGIQAARADAEATAAARDLVRVDTAAETARAYADACAYAQQADVARRSVQVASDTYTLTVRQRELGAASEFEVANARTLLEQTRAPISAYEAQRRASLYALAVLTGDPPERVDGAAAACRAPPRLVQPIPVGDGAGLIRRRPDIREAERRLAAASARIGVATADLYPTISLGGSVAGAGHGGGGGGSGSGLSYSLGPLVSWSFPNLVAARARVRQAEAATQAAYASFDGAVLTALQNVEQTLAIYGGELDRRAALQTAAAAAQRAYQLGQVRLAAGSISFVDLLTIQRTLISAQSELAASDAALVSDQVSAFKALGGGWGDPAPVPLPPLPTKANAGGAPGR